MAFPNVTDIVATTIEARGKDVADNVTNNNGLLAKLKSEGGVKTFSGGSEIQEAIAFAANGNAGWYSGYDTLAVAAQDVISAAKFSIKQLAAAVVISGLEEIQNSGEAAFIDLLDERMEVAENSLKNILSAGIYSDGTGSGGKQLTGLAAAVAIAPATGTYGGIDRATWTFWRNKKQKGGGTDFAGTLTTANVNSVYTTQWTSQVRGSDKPSLIVAEALHYNVYVTSLQPQQRFTDPKMAALGFDNVKFMSAPVILETTSSGIAAGTSYFLNTKYIKLRPYSGRNMVALDLTGSLNQDAKTQFMAWAGNMTCNAPQFQGIVQN